MAVQIQESHKGAHRIGRGSVRISRVQALHGAYATQGQHQVFIADQRIDVQGVPHEGAVRDQQHGGPRCQHRWRLTRHIREVASGRQVGQDHRSTGVHGGSQEQAQIPFLPAHGRATGQLARDRIHAGTGAQVQRGQDLLQQDRGLEHQHRLPVTDVHRTGGFQDHDMACQHRSDRREQRRKSCVAVT